MKNEPLYNSIKNFCQDSLIYLDSLGEKDLYKRHKKQYTFDGVGNYSCVNVQLYECTFFVLKNFKALKELETFELAVDCLEKDARISSHLNKNIYHGSYYQGNHITTEYILSKILIKILNRADNLILGKDFDDIYESCENYFYSDEVQYKYTALLEGFDADIDRIDLGDNFAIIKITNEDRGEVLSDLMSQEKIGQHIESTALYINNYLFEYNVSVPKIVTAEQKVLVEAESSGKVFEKVLLALRFYKRGPLFYRYIKRENVLCKVFFEDNINFNDDRVIRMTPIFRRYKLDTAELEHFLKLWSNIKIAITKNEELNIALRRFNVTYERKYLEDRLIDYMIAFESLLTEDNQELSYKISLRTAYLIGSEMERNKIFNDMKAAYGLRSKIVHGRKMGGIKSGGVNITFLEFIKIIENYLRRTTMAILHNQEVTIREQIQILDNKIIKGQ